MAHFFITSIEQMDLALDHLALNDPNYSRFAMMLIDNVVELLLHRHAQGVAFQEGLRFPGKKQRYSKALLDRAVADNFESKVALAAASGLVDESLRTTILTLHSIRNESYHQGYSNEGVSHALASFYYEIACDLFNSGPNGTGITIIEGKPLPLRVMKHIGNADISNITDLAPQVFLRLKAAGASIQSDLRNTLLEDAASVISYLSSRIDFLIVNGASNPTHQEVVKNSYYREGRKEDDSYASRKRHRKLGSKPPLDPVQTFKKQLERFKGETNPHTLLQKHKAFTDQILPVIFAIDGNATELQLTMQEERWSLGSS